MLSGQAAPFPSWHHKVSETDQEQLKEHGLSVKTIFPFQ